MAFSNTLNLKEAEYSSEIVDQFVVDIRELIAKPTDENLAWLSSYVLDSYLTNIVATGNIEESAQKAYWYEPFRSYNSEPESTVNKHKIVGHAIAKLNPDEILQLQKLLRDFDARSNGFNSHNYREILTNSLGDRMAKIAELFESDDGEHRRIAFNFFLHFNSFNAATRERFAENPNPNKGELYGAILALSDLNYSNYVLMRLEQAEKDLEALFEG